MNYVIYRKYGDVLGRGTPNTHGDLNKAQKQSVREENMSGLLLPKHTSGVRQTEGVPAFAPRLQTFGAQLAG